MQRRCSAPSITIGTGELNTAYNPIGDRLALLLRQKEGGKFYKADSVTTLGSVDNLAGLVKHTYDLAFVAGSELARATPEQKAAVAPIAQMFTNYIQIIAGKTTGDDQVKSDPEEDFTTFIKPTKLGHKPRIYLGRPHSGNRIFANRFLKAFGITSDQFLDSDAEEGRQSAMRHLTGRTPELDLAIVFSGVPTQGVDDAMLAGCRMLSIGRQISSDYVGFPVNLPPDTYANQAVPIPTLGDTVYLVAQRPIGCRHRGHIANPL